MRAQEFITELFAGGKEWKWRFQRDLQAVAEFQIDGVPYRFRALQQDPTIWEVSFEDATPGNDHNQMYGLNGKGNSAKVMATVVDILRSFLNDYQSKITKLTFNADEDSRQGLYAKMAHRLLPTWHIEQVGSNFELTAPANLQQDKEA